MNNKEIKFFLESLGFSEDPDVDGKFGQKGSYQIRFNFPVIRISHLELETMTNPTRKKILNIVGYALGSNLETFTKSLKKHFNDKRR